MWTNELKLASKIKHVNFISLWEWTWSLRILCWTHRLIKTEAYARCCVSFQEDKNKNNNNNNNKPKTKQNKKQTTKTTTRQKTKQKTKQNKTKQNKTNKQTKNTTKRCSCYDAHVEMCTSRPFLNRRCCS